MIQVSEWLVPALLRASAGLAVAALLVAACVRLLQVRSPRVEELAWLLVLIQGIVLVPITIPVAGGTVRPELVDGDDGNLFSRVRAPGPSEQPRARAIDGHPETPGSGPDSPADVQPTGPVSGSKHGSVFGRRPSWPVIGLLAWLAGVAACASLGLFRYRSFAARLHRAAEAPEDWQDEWRRTLEEHSVRTPIRLLASEELGPAFCLSPAGYRLVVPAPVWAELSSRQRASIMSHELAHYRRGDLWRALAAHVLVTVHWFNPLAWWAAARFEAQLEFLCDRAASEKDPASLAEGLIRLGSRRPARLAAVQSARTGDLFDRVHRLLLEPPRQARWRCAIPLVVALGALGPTAVRLQAVPGRGVADDGLASSQDPDRPGPGSQAGPLVQFGSNGLRTSFFIKDLAFSPDGKLIAAAQPNTQSPRVEVFDVKTGRAMAPLTPQRNPVGWVSCVAFSPDSTRLAWGEIGGQVALWDVPRRRLLFREPVHKKEVQDVAFSPDGGLFVSAGGDGMLQVRRTAEPGTAAGVIPVEEQDPAPGGYTGVPAGGFPVGPFRLAFTPDGTRLLAGSGSSSTVSVWRMQDRQLVLRIRDTHGGSGESANPILASLAVTPDGRRILTAGQRTVPIGQTKLKYGALNVTMSEVRLWDIATGRRVAELARGEDEGLGQAALSPDGSRVALADCGMLRILDASTGKLEWSIGVPGFFSGRVRFSPDGSFVALPINNSIGLFDVRTGQRLHHEPQSPVGSVLSAGWSTAGDRIVTGHEDGEVRVWEADTGKLVWHQVLAPVISQSGWNGAPAFVAFSQDGRRVVAAGRRDDPVEYKNGVVAVYEASRGIPVRRAFLREVRHAALTPDRKIVVAASSNGGADDTHLHGIEVETGRELYVAPPDEKGLGLWQMRSIRFRPDSRTLDLALGDGHVVQFDGVAGKEQKRFLADWRSPDQKRANRPSQPDLWEGDFGADGRILVSSSDAWLYVWDVEAGKLLRKIRHPHEHGCHVAVSPDGKTVATSDLYYSGDEGQNLIRLYDVATGQPILPVDPGDNRAVVLRFSPVGTKLFTGFMKGSAAIWDVRGGVRIQN